MTVLFVTIIFLGDVLFHLIICFIFDSTILFLIHEISRRQLLRGTYDVGQIIFAIVLIFNRLDASEMMRLRSSVLIVFVIIISVYCSSPLEHVNDDELLNLFISEKYVVVLFGKYLCETIVIRIRLQLILNIIIIILIQLFLCVLLIKVQQFSQCNCLISTLIVVGIKFFLFLVGLGKLYRLFGHVQYCDKFSCQLSIKF